MNSLDIKKIRASLGKTQTEFANLIGVSLSSVRAWERGDNSPKLKYILRIKKLAQNISAIPIVEVDKDHNIKIIKGIGTRHRKIKVITESGMEEIRLKLYADRFLEELETEELFMQNEDFEDNLELFKIEVASENMDDRTKDYLGSRKSLIKGDWVYCGVIPKSKWLLEEVYAGCKMFCFFHYERGVIFNKVEEFDLDKQQLKLSSLNLDKKKYPDFTIKLYECSHILCLKKVVSNIDS